MVNFDALHLRLKNQQTELEEKLSRLERDRRSAHSSDSTEQAQERENDEVLDALTDETRKQLADTTLALARFDKNLYGMCSLCGKPIDPARLAARPEALSCMTCG